MKNPRDKTFGRLVRLLRQAADMTRQQLALETGLPLGLVDQIEVGNLPPIPWMVRRLRRSVAMERLQHLASQFQIALDLGDLTVQDALTLYATATGGTNGARRLRQYFAASTLTKALGDLSTSDLAASASTSELLIAFLDWCTARGWLPSNPLRANGAHGRRRQ